MLTKLEKIRALASLKPSAGFYKANRARLVDAFKLVSKISQGFLIFKGPIEQPVYDDDNEFLHAGEANFTYLFGIEEPHTWGLIDLESEQSTLLVKESDPAKCYWMKIKTLKEFEEEFDGESVQKINNLADIIGLTSENKSEFAKKLFYMGGVNRETLATLHVPSKEDVGELCAEMLTVSPELYSLLARLRKEKSEEELKLMSHAADVNSIVLSSWLTYLKEGVSELQLVHHFQAISLYFGSFFAAFTPQVAIGKNVIKNYHNSSSFQTGKAGELAIFETGLKVNGYTSKIIRTFPVGGYFSENQQLIYSRIQMIYEFLLKEIKKGFTYVGLIQTLEQQLAEFLISEGIWKGEPEKLISGGTIRHFYEEDILHYIGVDVKDPLTIEFISGNEEGKPRGINAFFMKLGVIFDSKACSEIDGIDFAKLEKLHKEVGAIKFGDVIFVGADDFKHNCLFFPLQELRTKR